MRCLVADTLYRYEAFEGDLYLVEYAVLAASSWGPWIETEDGRVQVRNTTTPAARFAHETQTEALRWFIERQQRAVRFQLQLAGDALQLAADEQASLYKAQARL